MKPHSLVSRLLKDAALALLLVMLGMAVVFVVIAGRERSQAPWEGLQIHAKAIAQGIQFGPQHELIKVVPPKELVDSYDGLTKDLAYQVVDSFGKEIASSPAGPALDALRRLPILDASGMMQLNAEGVDLSIFSELVKNEGGSFLVRVARSNRLASEVRGVGGAIFFFTAVLTTLLALAAISWFVIRTSRKLAGPLQDVSRAASAINSTNLSARLTDAGLPAELSPLIASFNDALERLEVGYRVQQEFLAAAAHELKTPLSLVRAEIESLDISQKATILGDVDLMARQIHQLLHLAEASEVHNYVFEEVRIDESISDAIHFSSRLAERHDVLLEFQKTDEVTIARADRGALFILLKNLIENAIQHSPRGEKVVVLLEHGELAVNDHGPGVPPAERDEIFKRFRRGPQSRHAGAGLGLAICKEIAEAHRWTLDCEGARWPHGAAFRIRFSRQSVATKRP